MESLLIRQDNTELSIEEDDCSYLSDEEVSENLAITFHGPAEVPLPFGIDEKQDEVVFVDPSHGEGKRIIFDPETSIAELFAVLRQFVSPVCTKINLIIDEMLKRRVGVNDVDLTTGMSMLHYVIRAESLSNDKPTIERTLQSLLTSGADISQRTMLTDMNAIHLASYFNSVRCLKILLDQSNDPAESTQDLCCEEFDCGTALHIAATNLSTEAAEILIKWGADKQVRDDLGRTPKSCIPRNFHCEEEKRCAEKLKMILSSSYVKSPPGQRARKIEKSVTFQKSSVKKTPERKSISHQFSVGDRILVADSKPGVVKFVGSTKFASGTWCGIELDEPFGRNDGSINGVRYFSCDRTKGVFAPPSKLKLIPPNPDDQLKGTKCVTSSSGNIWRQVPPMLHTSSSSQDDQPRLKLGMTVLVDHLEEKGKIRYMGETDFASGVWIGLELNSPHGKNNGCVDGRKYFTCKHKHGIMVRPSRISMDGVTGDDLI